jgi:signal peptidase I
MLVAFLFASWVVGVIAQLVKSHRGQFKWGLLSVGLLTALGIVLLTCLFILPKNQLILRAGLIIFDYIASYFILKIVFELSIGRAFAVFGAYFGVNIAVLVIEMVLIKAFILEPFSLPGGVQSMSPTLVAGSRFVANKLLTPRRWDLVVYRHNGPRHEPWVKRLIALPGEKLRFEHGTIYINDHTVDVPPVLAGRCHASLAYTGGPGTGYHDGQTIELGPDEIFLIGDNVEVSRDSRIEGPSKQSSIVGVVDLIYWPGSRARVVR